jgi:phenylpyruvate tautomerase PptA (4-oxalocrotonate tautomerase family)
MPDVLVEVRGSWLGARKSQFLDAVQTALVETLRVPADDKVLRLIEHAHANYLIPGGAGEKFTRIEIAMFVGRSREAKRALHREIVRRLTPFGVPAEDVKIVLVEVPTENVGIRGGQAACDIDLGYALSV